MYKSSKFFIFATKGRILNSLNETFETNILSNSIISATEPKRSLFPSQFYNGGNVLHLCYMLKTSNLVPFLTLFLLLFCAFFGFQLQEGGWPLGLQPFNVRVGLLRNLDFSGSLSLNTIITDDSPTSSSSASSSSDIDTEVQS